MARMSIDDSALRDPRIRRMARMLHEKFGNDVRAWPDFAERYALATLTHVWALPYDRVHPVVPQDDVDETAKIDNFADAMVVVGLGTNEVDGLRIKGAKKRIGYLERAEETGRTGGQRSGDVRRENAKLPAKEPLALPPGDDDKPTKAKKPKKEKTEGYHAVVEHFHNRYMLVFGKKPTWNGKTGRLLTALIKAHDAAEVSRRIDVLFDAPPSFLASSAPDIGTLSQHFDKLVGARPNANGHGRHEPRDNADRTKAPWED